MLGACSQAQGWPGMGWHQHQASQAGAAFVPRVRAQVAPGAEGSLPSWWELTEVISRVQAGQRSS